MFRRCPRGRMPSPLVRTRASPLYDAMHAQRTLCCRERLHRVPSSRPKPYRRTIESESYRRFVARWRPKR